MHPKCDQHKKRKKKGKNRKKEKKNINPRLKPL